jgi:hypothetical protein
MLKNKPPHIDIPEELWKEMMQNVRDGIFRKLKAARGSIAIDKDVAAGVYVYAVEEFGKLLLLKKATALNGMRRVIYRDEFVNHNRKFKAAFDWFQANGHDPLVISETWFVDGLFAWDIIEKRFLAETEARLLIFYSDFTYDDKNQMIVIERPPVVALDKLQKAIDGLDMATNSLTIL